MSNTDYLADLSKRIVFVVGSPRSGTTWLARLLGVHPKIRIGHESGIFDTYIGPQIKAWNRDNIPANSGRGIIGLGCYVNQSQFESLITNYLAEILRSSLHFLSDDELFIEKTPSHALFMKEIKALLPYARFICVYRQSPRVVNSLLAASKTWGSSWAPRTLRDASKMWNEHTLAMIYNTHHFEKSHSMNIYYEKIQTSPIEMLSEIYDYLQLDVPQILKERSVELNRFGLPGTPIPLFGLAKELIGDYLVEPAGFSDISRSRRLGLISDVRVWRFTNSIMKLAGYDWDSPLAPPCIK